MWKWLFFKTCSFEQKFDILNNPSKRIGVLFCPKKTQKNFFCKKPSNSVFSITIFLWKRIQKLLIFLCFHCFQNKCLIQSNFLNIQQKINNIKLIITELINELKINKWKKNTERYNWKIFGIDRIQWKISKWIQPINETN